MGYFKSKSGNIFYKSAYRSYLTINMLDGELINEGAKFDEDFHIQITKEEFINAYELVVKNLNEKVYGSK